MYTPPLYHWPSKAFWEQTVLGPRQWNLGSVYFHYPFCRSICDFCGYFTEKISKNAIEPYAEALLDQVRMRLQSDSLGKRPIQSIFFGGGTASLMGVDLLESILECLRPYVEQGETEITLECEPGTISINKLRDIRSLGVNRISVAAQALDNKTLEASGRRHSSEDSISLIEASRDVGFENIHVDLIYGLPGQTYNEWLSTLEKVIQLPVSHVSCYRLYVFKNGKLAQQRIAPRARSESEEYSELLERMYAGISPILCGNEFSQYTLTEYAKQGKKCQYVISCFDGSDVLPFGASAFGRCGHMLLENSRYIARFNEYMLSARTYKLTPEECFRRDLILGMWLLKVSITDLESRYGVQRSCALQDLLRSWASEGVLDFKDDSILLSQDGAYDAGSLMETLSNMDCCCMLAS